MLFRFALQVNLLPVEAGCKGTVALFVFASDSKNKFLKLVCGRR